MAGLTTTEALPSTDLGWQVELFTAIFVPVQLVVVGLRFYARRVSKTSWGWDDGLVLVSLACQVAQASTDIAAVQRGDIGHEIGYIASTTPTTLIIWRKYMTALSIFYFATLNIPKLAILALFQRLFPAKTPRRIVYILAGVVDSHSIGTTLVALVACRPLAANWDVSLQAQGAVRIDKNALEVWSSLPSIATDVVMLIFPLPLVWKLHTNTRMKIGLTLTFAVGSLGLATAIVRFLGFFQNCYSGSIFNGVGLLIWMEAEPGVYLISACLPTYRPLLEPLGIGRLVASWGLSNGSRRSQGYAHQIRASRRIESIEGAKLVPRGDVHQEKAYDSGQDSLGPKQEASLAGFSFEL